MHASTLKYFAHSFYINRNDDPQHVLGCLHACVLLLCDRSAISSLVCHAHEPLEVPESRLWADFLIYKFQYICSRAAVKNSCTVCCGIFRSVLQFIIWLQKCRSTGQSHSALLHICAKTHSARFCFCASTLLRKKPTLRFC